MGDIVLRENKWFFFQKNKKALRRIDGINDSLWQICLNVVYISSIFLSDETLEQRTYDNKLPFAVSTFKQIRGVIRKIFLAFAIFKCLQVKIINIPKWYILGYMSWTSTVVFLGSMFCHLSEDNFHIKNKNTLIW